MLEVWSEAEKLFYSEIREKKKAASGVHHKTGKNGYVGNMRFPTDIMSRREKYNYRKAGKVMTTNIFDQILPIDEFNKLEDYEKRNRLQYWRTEKTNKEILKAMGINNTKYYEIVTQLNLPKAPRTMTGSRKGTTKTPAKVETPAEVKKQQETALKEVVQEIIVDGLHLVFHGTHKAEYIQKQLKKFTTLLEDEQDDFYIEIKLMQKVKSM